MQKIFRLLLVALAIIIGVVWFAHWSKTRAHNAASVPANQQTQPGTPGATAGNPTAPAATPDQTSPPQEVASAPPNAAPSVPMVPQGPGPITEQPTANALSPHPPAGFVTPATQKFALYRQGDLTYRLNTQSGQACILLASEDLWRKPLVYQHGCGNR
jgi:uncharacterized iron-regulated membrane protein